MLNLRTWLLVVLSLCSVSPATGHAFSQKQKHLLQIAENEGKLVGYPETIQAILLQETNAGKIGSGAFGIIGDHSLGFGKKSYGVMQVRLATAKDVIRRNPDIAKAYTDEEIIIGLVTDPLFCIRIAALHFRWLTKRYVNGHRITWRQAVEAYNAGLGNIEAGRKYLGGVRKYITNLRREDANI